MEKRRKVYKMELASEEDGIFALSLVESPAIESNWLYLSKAIPVNLKSVDNEKRMLIGPALIPDMEIPRYSDSGEEYAITFPSDVVERSAQLFMQKQFNNSATLEHSEEVSDVSVVESWIVADPELDKSAFYGMKQRAGTWMVGVKVNNDSIWEDYVKTGKVKGFSIEGLYSHKLVNASVENGDKAKVDAIKSLFDVYRK